MQKDIGSVMGLYPTPVTIVGVKGPERVNFLPIAHVGVVEHQRFVVSIDKNHELSDAAIRANGQLSVSLVSQDMMVRADWCGCEKGATTDKSGAFAHHFLDDMPAAPVIDEAPVCMLCEVVDSFEVGNFHNYILKAHHTLVQEECLTEKDKIDYEKASPVLFEFQSAQYLSTGKVIGKCWKIGRDWASA